MARLFSVRLRVIPIPEIQFTPYLENIEILQRFLKENIDIFPF